MILTSINFKLLQNIVLNILHFTLFHDYILFYDISTFRINV